ncbi:extracellular solute-binding protein [Pseudonocardia acaciae]|uniref:extracellular solute-binding protein n=1 Tax=Pseudonocardia acaciae TaxID=551276 RepID=UPI00048E82DF|nr:extracellular solute-binding protein [Pseudonocardia acaciae]
MRLRAATALLAAVASATTLAACGGTNTGDTAGTITVSTWGGDFTAAEKKWFGDPFTAETGIKVEYRALSTSPMTPVLLQAQSGDVKVDVVDAESPAVLRSKNLLAPFPPELMRKLQETSRPESFLPDAMKIGQTGMVIACNPDLVRRCPESPQQFWDVDAYPGRRGILVGLPQTVLDFALVADGVSPAQVYPLDIDRAIGKLHRIKPQVAVWAQSPAQAQQLLADKEVGIEYIDHPGAFLVQRNRIPNLKVSWAGSMSTNDAMVVTRDAPNKAAAFAYLSWIADHPKNQAGWAEALTYSTPTTRLRELVPPATWDALPAAHSSTAEDDQWLVAHLPEVQRAFQRFTAG